MTVDRKVPRMICGDCRYLGVTYQPRNPWKCGRFAFKSKDLPAAVVFRETGTECAFYHPKAPIARNTK